MDVYNQIKASAYQPQSDYPSYTTDKLKRTKMIAKYDAEKEVLRGQFYLDICEHFGLKPSRRSTKLFDFAWNEASSGGHAEVANFFANLLNLVSSLNED